MRRADCSHCGVVVVEQVPWDDGKHQLTNAYMLFLARWARRLSRKEMRSSHVYARSDQFWGRLTCSHTFGMRLLPPRGDGPGRRPWRRVA
jgi:hypothetical protein